MAVSKEELFKYRITTIGPIELDGHPGFFRVMFWPKQMMAARGPNEAPQLIKIWDASVLVNSLGEVVGFSPLDPPLDDAPDEVLKARAVELVLEVVAKKNTAN